MGIIAALDMSPHPQRFVEEIVDEKTTSSSPQNKEAEAAVTVLDDDSIENSQTPNHGLPPVPLRMKLLSVLLVSCIGFGSQWSSGVSGAMKSTIKKVWFGVYFKREELSLMVASGSNCTSTTHNSHFWKPARISCLRPSFFSPASLQTD